MLEFSTEPGNDRDQQSDQSDAYELSAFFPPVFAAYFRSRADDETCGFIRKRDSASPRFWMNASD